MQVIATKRGYDNVTIREPGDKFEMPDDARGSWFRPADGTPVEQAPEPVKSKRPPKTMSEAAGVKQIGLQEQKAADTDLA